MDKKNFAPQCLSIDLEVGRDDRIYEFSAVRGDDGRALTPGKNKVREGLAEVSDFSQGLKFLLGHNIRKFDLPHLRAAKPELELLSWPVIDTLWLNPLAFPRNPYHRLVKHYQDGQLSKGQLNDPELDARLTLDVFYDQCEAFRSLTESNPSLLAAWHWLTTRDEYELALDELFSEIREAPKPSESAGYEIIRDYLAVDCCEAAINDVLGAIDEQPWEIAYVMAWLSVSGANSVVPPWVRHQFPAVSALITRLRDTPCHKPSCNWCKEQHSPRAQLQRWFGFEDFRPLPADSDGRSLQAVIVEAAMGGEHVLGVLPTGTGKSLCYQIPALSRYEKTGALTVVISPLVALMADQVAGLEAHGINSCAALNGLLSMPERSHVLDRVRLGDIAILIVSPEQLRSPALRKVLKQREIGAWVLDEAHCISKWGHDFRPDYRYVGRFIGEWSPDEKIAPILCLTATAKPDVIDDIIQHFDTKVRAKLRPVDGGSKRTNLEFDVVPTSASHKFQDIHDQLSAHLPDNESGAIVYCATRKQTEEIADFLKAKGFAAEAFHAKLKPETKKTVQDDFISGHLRVIVATNAFGMGIDKSDVRLVIHADIPGSLENYLQEAGRAGRDREAARCVLLYNIDDVERQFSMAAHSRLTQREIALILNALQRLARKKKDDSEIVATAGEILSQDTEGQFERDTATDDTKVRTALLWLEEAQLLSREENRVQIFPSSMRVNSVEDAKKKLQQAELIPKYANQLLTIVDALIASEPDQGVDTDELMGLTGLSSEEIRKALYDLEHLGLVKNDTAITAYVHVGVPLSSKKRFENKRSLENELIDLMRESDPDLARGESSALHVRSVTQRLKDNGVTNALPEEVRRALRSLAEDGKSEASGIGSIVLKKMGQETESITLLRNWTELAKTAERRTKGAAVILMHLEKALPASARGNDLLAETTLGDIRKAIESDIELQALNITNPAKLIESGLLWLDRHKIIKLNKGLAIFRPAMTIKLSEDNRRFVGSDFRPLKEHYSEQTIQIHVMAEYAERALKAMAEAIQLTIDYFKLEQTDFIKRWLTDRLKDISRQTTPQSYRSIVENLNNPVQQKIVSDDRERTNVLVLAGPGSGKTRVLVHRIAYLIRVRRENPGGILALAYNRHAASEIRKRLYALIGDDANGVTVMTCHALAMRLVGASFQGKDATTTNFDEILQQAAELLRGEGLDADDADAQRSELLGSYRWILVDEYQDVDKTQYDLISAIAGKSIDDPVGRLSLFAVGDDDQNIYAFTGASVEFIRRFAEDYQAKPSFLIENYRSSLNIVQAANCVIQGAADRMKEAHPIKVDDARDKLPAGGAWQDLDPVSNGKVQVISTTAEQTDQAFLAMQELERLASLDAEWDWSKVAIIAREWKYLEPVRAYCELFDVPVQMANEQAPSLWRMRETQQLIRWINERDSALVSMEAIQAWLEEQGDGPWWEQLKELVADLKLELGEAEIPCQHFVESVVEWGRDMRRRQSALLLTTAHRAKGLEFDHVLVLDGAWEKVGENEDADASRRLYYVGMSRAKQTLTLMQMPAINPFLSAETTDESVFLKRELQDVDPDVSRNLQKRYLTLTLKDVDIGYAGRQPSNHRIHKCISAIQPSDQLTLRFTDNKWTLLDSAGETVGCMAKNFVPPPDKRLESCRVHAIMQRGRQDTPDDWQHTVKCDEWEVLLPELTYGAE